MPPSPLSYPAPDCGEKECRYMRGCRGGGLTGVTCLHNPCVLKVNFIARNHYGYTTLTLLATEKSGEINVAT